MPKDERLRLLHMIEAARKAIEFSQGLDRKDLDGDEKLQLALVRLLEILGEAAKKVPPEIRGRYPAIPWWEICATRDRLIHGYFSIDLDIVWSIVTEDLPPLLKALERITSDLGIGK